MSRAKKQSFVEDILDLDDFIGAVPDPSVKEKQNQSKEVKQKENKKLDRVAEIMDQMMTGILSMFGVDEIYDKLAPEVEKRFREEFGCIPKIHTVIDSKGAEHSLSGITHEMFDTVLNLINLRIPVYMSGLSGTGKNVIAKQVAQALGLEFYFTNAVTQEYKLTGFIDASGKYHETQFYKAFTQGGLFFLDEMDASIPEVLVILNAAIANGYFDFPTGKVTAHPNFRVIAAGNTLGTGADSQYTGRYCLDRASLDRFAVVHIDYSPAIDMEMCGGDQELYKFITAFRLATSKTGIQCVCSYRSADRIHTLDATHIADMKTIMRMSLIKDLDIDDIKILYNEVKKIVNNRFTEGLNQV